MNSVLAVPPGLSTAQGAAQPHDTAALVALREATGREHPHLLLPIENAARSNWCVAFVLACHRAGWRGEATVLHVIQGAAPASVLRSRDAEQPDAEQAGHIELQAVSARLMEAGIKARTSLRNGSVVFAILDAAEQLACDVVVVPRARQRMFGVASRGVVYRLERSVRDVPLLTIDRDGRPSRPSHPS